MKKFILLVISISLMGGLIIFLFLNKQDKIFQNQLQNQRETVPISNTVYFKGNEFSFIGDKNKITAHYLDAVENFFYNDLEISTTLKGPYAVYTDVDTSKITFICNSSLINFNSDDFTGLGRRNVNSQYCETNKKDFLTQFEFSAANGTGHAAGGEITESWHKLYIKNIKDVNYIFIGQLKGEYLESPNFEATQKYKDDYLYISSKEYLNEVLSDTENIIKIEEWDKFVDSFDIVY